MARREPVEEMESRLGVPVQLDNDANVGALGEGSFGAARGVDNFIYLRLAAGIGAGLNLGGSHIPAPAVWLGKLATSLRVKTD